MKDVSEQELTVEVIKKNPWNAVRLGVSKATPEAVLLYASDTILVLTTELLSHRAEAVERNDLAAARALHEHYLEAETRADMVQVLLNRADDQRFAAVLAKLNENLASSPLLETKMEIAETANKPFKQSQKLLPEGVHPHSAYWYTKKGGIDELNCGERMVLSADYAKWVENNPEAAKRYTQDDYCIFRQRRYAQKAQRNFSRFSKQHG